MKQSVLGELVVAQLFKVFPTYLWNPKVHYRVHKSPPLGHVLCQMNSVITPKHNFFKINFINIPSMPRSPK